MLTEVHPLVSHTSQNTLLNGGQKIEETDAFRVALLREKERIRLEQEVIYDHD